MSLIQTIWFTLLYESVTACSHCPSDFLFPIPIFFQILWVVCNMQKLFILLPIPIFFPISLGAVPICFRCQKQNRKEKKSNGQCEQTVRLDRLRYCIICYIVHFLVEKYFRKHQSILILTNILQITRFKCILKQDMLIMHIILINYERPQSHQFMPF